MVIELKTRSHQEVEVEGDTSRRLFFTNTLKFALFHRLMCWWYKYDVTASMHPNIIHMRCVVRLLGMEVRVRA